MFSFIRYQTRILLKGVDTLSKYYSIHEFSKIIGVSAQTLRNWDENGNIDNTEKSEQQELFQGLAKIPKIQVQKEINAEVLSGQR